jgi:hypothetical protein
MQDEGSAFGVAGVFLTLLGAGVILDADCVGMGAIMMTAGIACLAAEARRSDGSTSS